MYMYIRERRGVAEYTSTIRMYVCICIYANSKTIRMYVCICIYANSILKEASDH